MKNHYGILGLKRNATDDEIKKAYRKLALKFHPDINNGDKFFENIFREVQEAYEVLSNPQNKAVYDYALDMFILQIFKDGTQHTHSNPSSNQNNIKEEKIQVKKKRWTILSKIYDIKEYIKYCIQNTKKSYAKGKFKFIFIMFLWILPIIALLVNSFSGLFTILGIYFFVSTFIDSIKEQSNIRSVGDFIFNYIACPIIALFLLYQVINFFRDKPMEDDQRYSSPKTQTNHSQYKGNQLSTGETPLSSCFGNGVSNGNAQLTIRNGGSSDAIVCLFSLRKNRTIRNAYIRRNDDFTMYSIPSGYYKIRVLCGNDWNPRILNSCGTSGDFENDKYLTEFENSQYFEDSDSGYTTSTVTLYSVSNGNASTRRIDQSTFFR